MGGALDGIIALREGDTITRQQVKVINDAAVAINTVDEMLQEISDDLRSMQDQINDILLRMGY